MPQLSTSSMLGIAIVIGIIFLIASTHYTRGKLLKNQPEISTKARLISKDKESFGFITRLFMKVHVLTFLLDDGREKRFTMKKRWQYDQVAINDTGTLRYKEVEGMRMFIDFTKDDQ